MRGRESEGGVMREERLGDCESRAREGGGVYESRERGGDRESRE